MNLPRDSHLDLVELPFDFSQSLLLTKEIPVHASRFLVKTICYCVVLVENRHHILHKCED